MNNNMNEDLEKIFDKLAGLEDGQLKITQQIESLTNNQKEANPIQTNNETLKRQQQQIDFLMYKVGVLEEEIFILQKSKAKGN